MPAEPPAGPSTGEPTVASAQSPIAPGDLPFEVVRESELPARLAAWKSLAESPSQPPHERVNEYLYVMVGQFPQSSGGYTLTVSRVELLTQPKPTVQVHALLTTPAPGQMTTSVITYPKVYIRIPYKGSNPDPAVTATVQRQTSTVGAGPIGNPTSPTPPPPPTAQPSPTPTRFELIDPARLPAALDPWRSSRAELPGAAATYAGDSLYLMVAAGEQRTGGYSVEVTGVSVEGGRVKVQAVLHKPKPGQIVTQALTYPKAFVRLAAQGSGSPPVDLQWH